MKDVVFVYGDGKFTPRQAEEEEEGWSLSQSVGDADGLHYDLHEREDAGSLLWKVDFCTACFFCTVHVKTWPDLIQLLSMLSPVVLAGLIQCGDDGKGNKYHGFLPVMQIKPY